MRNVRMSLLVTAGTVLLAVMAAQAMAAEWVKIVKPLPDVSTTIKVGDEYRVRSTFGDGADKVYTIEVGGEVLTVKASDVQVLDPALTAAREVKILEAELNAVKAQVAQLRAENAQLKANIARLEAAQAAVGPAQKPPVERAAAAADDAKQIMHPLLDQPAPLKNLYTLLKGKQVATGFIAKPLRIGVTGHVESVFVERIIDKTNMVAQIRFPELRHIEMAPGAPPGAYVGTTPKMWQTGDERVWIADIDTSGLVDDQVIYLTETLKVTDTVNPGDGVIFRLAPAK